MQNWYSITSDIAWKLAKEKGYKTFSKKLCSIRFVYCTKKQWLELDSSHVWLQDQYGRKTT